MFTIRKLFYLCLFTFVFTYFHSIIVMNYTEGQLLVLRPYRGNSISLAMHTSKETHPKQMGCDPSYLINVPLTPYYCTSVENVRIGLINCESMCNKSDEISDVVKDMDIVITETWLTGNVSDQKIVGDVTPAGYSFHHAVRIHKKVGESAFFSVIL